jgi:hypothetical protein
VLVVEVLAPPDVLVLAGEVVADGLEEELLPQPASTAPPITTTANNEVSLLVIVLLC